MSPWNRNYGGSLFAMADLFWMLLTMHALGHGYVVWDEAGEIEFVASGRVRINSVAGIQYFRCAWHCAPLRYQRLVSLDATFPARTIFSSANPSAGVPGLTQQRPEGRSTRSRRTPAS